MRLTTGKKYDYETIKRFVFCGWSNGSKFNTDIPGYSYWEYFNNGVYLGPDVYGVEPVFSDDIVNVDVD